MPDTEEQVWPGSDGAFLLLITSIIVAIALYKGEPRAFAPVCFAMTASVLYLSWTRWMRA